MFRILVGVTILTLVIGMTVLVSGSSPPADAEQVTQRPDIPPAGPELDRARATVTFDIPLPSYVPEGAELLNVVYSAPGLGQPESSGVSAVDIWYQLVDGRRVHLWFSDTDLEADGQLPEHDRRARPVELSNGTWYEMILSSWDPPSTALARRIGDVNVEMDLQGNATELRRMAASFDVD
jgi:hypothetical protein